MKILMKIFWTLLKKDLKILLLRPVVLQLQLSLSLILAVIMAIGVQSIALPPSQLVKLYPVALFVIFVFSASISLGKSLDIELESGVVDIYIVRKLSPQMIYLAKFCANFLVFAVALLFLAVVLGLLMSVSVKSWGLLALVGALTVSAYSALGTLLTAISARSMIGGILLPLIFLPLLFPLFFAALELSLELLLNNTFSFGGVWFPLLLLLNVLYLVIGINLYEHAIK